MKRILLSLVLIWASLPALGLAQTVNIRGGYTAHDGPASSIPPVLTGCYASAAAPTDVSADTDAAREWCLRNGARAVQPTFAGVLASTGAGATGTGVQRVNPVSSSATGAAPPAAASHIGGLGSGATGGFLIGIAVSDTFKTVSVTSATTTLLITGVAGRHIRIGSINLMSAIANNVALISGTGATCGTGTTGIAGGTTAANGWNLAANGGLAYGSGLGTIMQTTATGDSICVVTSSVGPLAGTIGYAIY